MVDQENISIKAKFCFYTEGLGAGAKISDGLNALNLHELMIDSHDENFLMLENYSHLCSIEFP